MKRINSALLIAIVITSFTLLEACKKDVDIVEKSITPEEATTYYSFENEKWVVSGLYQDPFNSNGGEYSAELTSLKDTTYKNGNRFVTHTILVGKVKYEGFPEQEVEIYADKRNHGSSLRMQCYRKWGHLSEPVDSINPGSSDVSFIRFHGKVFRTFKNHANRPVVWGASLTPFGNSSIVPHDGALFQIRESYYIVDNDTLDLSNPTATR